MTRPLDDLSIVMPVYNEAAAIERVLRELHSKVASRLQHVEFVVDSDYDKASPALERLTVKSRWNRALPTSRC